MYKIIFALLYLEEQKYFLLYMLLLFFIRVVYIIWNICFTRFKFLKMYLHTIIIYIYTCLFHLSVFFLSLHIYIMYTYINDTSYITLYLFFFGFFFLFGSGLFGISSNHFTGFLLKHGQLGIAIMHAITTPIHHT